MLIGFALITDYLYEVKRYYDVLLPKLVKYLYGNCGPVISIQVTQVLLESKLTVIFMQNLFITFSEQILILYEFSTSSNQLSKRCYFLRLLIETIPQRSEPMKCSKKLPYVSINTPYQLIVPHDVRSSSLFQSSIVNLMKKCS